MSIADELRKLEDLHRTGALTEEEFARAKAAVLQGAPAAPGPAGHDGNLFPIDVDESLTPQRLTPMRIVAGALLLGCLVFLGIVLFMVLGLRDGRGTALVQDVPILSLAAVAMLAVCGPLAFLLPARITRLALGQILAGTWTMPPGGDPRAFASGGAKLLAVRQMTLIVGLAMLEGTAFLGCVAYLIEAHPLALGVVGVALALMLCQFPTEGRVRAWLERQADALGELRLQRQMVGER
jgi:hypothetical protein